MNIFFNIIIFIIGTLFGSFYTLAIHRIPKKQDITHTNSYCPNCNHKLQFLDLIPIFSYVFLGGKCRYCEEKIRPRYLILEILSGFSFVMAANFMNLKIEFLTVSKIIQYTFFMLYLTYIFITLGIDKQNRKIEKSVSIYGIILSVIYMIYVCIVDKTNIYRYVIYIACYIQLILLDTMTLKKQSKSTYTNGILVVVMTMAVFTGELITAYSIGITVLSMAICLLINKLKNLKSKAKDKKSDKEVTKGISIGYLLGVSNIIYIMMIMILNIKLV